MLTLIDDRLAWNRQLSVSAALPLFVRRDVDLDSRATVRGWRLASWSALGFEVVASRDRACWRT